MIFSLLDKIRVRPGMYLGYISPTNLQSFLHGYTFERELKKTDELGQLATFNDWLGKKLNYYEPTSGWAHMIEDQREDRNEALIYLYELWDEFRNIDRQLVSESVDIKEDQIDRTWRGYARLKKKNGTFEAIHKPTPIKLVIKEIFLDKVYYSLIAKSSMNRTLLNVYVSSIKDAKNSALRIFGTELDSWIDENPMPDV